MPPIESAPTPRPADFHRIYGPEIRHADAVVHHREVTVVIPPAALERLVIEAAERHAGITSDGCLAKVDFVTVAVGFPVYRLGTEARVSITQNLDSEGRDGGRWVYERRDEAGALTRTFL